MLHIFPTDNPSLRASLFAAQYLAPGLPGQFGPDDVALVALDGGELVGACLFRIERETLRLLALPLGDEDDRGLADGLLRVAFDYALQRGARVARPEGEPLRALCESLGFLRADRGEIDLETALAHTGCG